MSPIIFLKAVFQGDGLETVRLNLSVGGWELPSGRNAKGCLEAVKTTAGECPIKRAKKGVPFNADVFIVFILMSMQFNMSWGQYFREVGIHNAAKPWRLGYLGENILQISYVNSDSSGLIPLSNRLKYARKSAMVRAQLDDS